MEFDKSVLEKLSAHERLKINRQLRQKQIESYLKFVRDLKERGGGSVKKPCKPNRKNTRPFFPEDILLQDAVENFDDKEGKLRLHVQVNKFVANVHVHVIYIYI